MREFLTFSLCRYTTNPNASYISELLYIHSKLMIVDDMRVIASIIF